MKYVCATCNKVFLHTAKTVKALDGKGERGVIIGNMAVQVDTVESAVCPFCHSLEYNEYEEAESLVVSIKKVPHEEADKLIAEGYQPKEYYAKDVVMVKRETTKPAELDTYDQTISDEGVMDD